MENKAINLSQGYPDFEVDPILINSVAKYMKLGFNQYANLLVIDWPYNVGYSFAKNKKSFQLRKDPVVL